MLYNTQSLTGRRLSATDGEFGLVKDFYFDDQTWMVRYLVADTGTWLMGRTVLLPANAFENTPFPDTEHLSVNLSRKQIEDSPPITEQQTVSRQYEEQFYNHYGWPGYWQTGGMWGSTLMPVAMIPPVEPQIVAVKEDCHLQSMKEILGYHIHATDGEIGSVTGFMIDDQTWEVRELAVESGHWYSGKQIYLLVENIVQISYTDSTVFVDLAMDDIRETAENHVVHC